MASRNIFGSKFSVSPVDSDIYDVPADDIEIKMSSSSVCVSKSKTEPIEASSITRQDPEISENRELQGFKSLPVDQRRPRLLPPSRNSQQQHEPDFSRRADHRRARFEERVNALQLDIRKLSVRVAEVERRQHRQHKFDRCFQQLMMTAILITTLSGLVIMALRKFVDA